MADRRRRQRRRRRRARVFRDRFLIDNYDDKDLHDKFRFKRPTILFLIDLLTPYIQFPTARSRCVSLTLQVLAALRYFATGAHMLLIGDSLGLSQPTVSRCIKRVATALLRFMKRYIKFPVEHEQADVKRGFYQLAGFPNVLSVVDGTFIRIIAPSTNEPDFVNRKGFHSLNVQVACDSNFRITNIVSSWPGSVHDSRIFKNSELCRKFESGVHHGLLLGDSGYPCRNFLMTPYSVPQTPAQERFNKSLCRTRVVVEQMIGVIKRRFNCLHVGMNVKPNTAALYTVSCAILHNIGIERGDILQIDNMELPQIHDVPVLQERNDGESMRHQICCSFFS